MKKTKIILSVLLSLFIIFLMCVPAFASEASVEFTNGEAFGSLDTLVSSIQRQNTAYINKKLYVGGMPFGVRILSKGLSVVGFAEENGQSLSPAYDAGIRLGDIVIKVNSYDISSIEDFSKRLNENGNRPVSLTVERNGKNLNFTFTPKYYSKDKSYKAGLLLKDSTSGIGTVTFIDPETNIFGGLGHGICDANSGALIPLSKGIIMDVTINGVNKGKIGTAGELRGSFKLKKIGSLMNNTSCGVFGLLSDNCVKSPESLMNICPKNQVKEGDAYIWCTLSDGAPQKYAIQISNIDTTSSSAKSFKIKVVDPLLLSKTGGIVQGMSGSPIIQNGRLIGAVTHVLINDPTTGYGIFIENMLNQIGN